MASRIGNLLASSDPVPTQSDPEFANYNNVERRLIVKSGGDKTKLLKLYRRVKGRGGYFAGAKHSFAVVAGVACTAPAEVQADITSDLLRTNGNFGSGVLLRGNVLLVGERRAVGTIFEVGQGHLFTRPNESSDFTYQSSFNPITEGSGGAGGESLAANSDCTIIAMGAPNNNGGAGRVSTYTRSGTVVSDDDELVPNTAQTAAYFGADMGMSSDGNHLIVSLPGYDGGDGTDQGLVEYWENVAGTWTYRSDISSGTAFVSAQRFGHACTMNPDGTECWIMKRTGTNTSEIQRFTRSGTTWTYQDNFALSYGTGQMNSLVGSMDANSTRIIFGFGARDTVSNNEGFVLVTDHDGVETSSIDGDTLETEFGNAVSIDETNEAAIGEWLADPSSTTNAGLAHIWTVC